MVLPRLPGGRHRTSWRKKDPPPEIIRTSFRIPQPKPPLPPRNLSAPPDFAGTNRNRQHLRTGTHISHSDPFAAAAAAASVNGAIPFIVTNNPMIPPPNPPPFEQLQQQIHHQQQQQQRQQQYQYQNMEGNNPNYGRSNSGPGGPPQRPRSRSKGPPQRRLTNDGKSDNAAPVVRGRHKRRNSGSAPTQQSLNGSTGGKSYSEIRDQYNIPSIPNTLPPGVEPGLSGPEQRKIKGVEPGLSASEQRKNKGKTRRHQRSNSLNGRMTTAAAMDDDDGNNNNIGNSGRSRGRERSDTSMAAHSVNTGMTSGMNTLKMGSKSMVQPKGTNARRRKSAGSMAIAAMMAGEGYASDVENGNNNKNAGGGGGPPPGGPPRNIMRSSIRRRISVSDGGYSSSDGEGFRRRRTLDSASRPGAIPGAGSGSDSQGSHMATSAGVQKALARRKRRGTLGSGEMDQSHETQWANDNGLRRGSMASGGGGGLKALPENKSFRGSNRFNISCDALGFGNTTGVRDLESMTPEELKEELQGHGISVEGMYERNDLISVCAQARKKKERVASSYKPVGRSSSSGGLNNLDKKNGSASTTTPRRKSINSASGVRKKGREKSLDRSSKSKRGSDTRSDVANPQQGMMSLAAGGNAAALDKSNRSSGRRSTRSSFSSLGDPKLDEEMALPNAGFPGDDVHNPNAQMGLLLQQMQQLGEQMGQSPQPPPEPQQRGRKPARRMSGHSSVKSSRGKQGDVSAGIGKGDRRLTGSSSGPPSRNSSIRELTSSNTQGQGGSAKDLMGGAKMGMDNKNLTASGRAKKPLTGGLLGVVSTTPEVGVDKAGTPGDAMTITSSTVMPEKKKRKLSKKTLVIVLLSVIAAGALAASLLFMFNGSPIEKKEEGATAASIDSVAPVSSPTATPAEDGVYLEPPPSDIEGRCSPSNLPGSLAACLSACQPSSCCYPDYDFSSSKEVSSCIDKNDAKSIEACSRYRPYCDIFYDPWPSATDGVLRTPSQNILQMCTLNNISSVNNNDGNETTGELEPVADESFVERMRLRGHADSHRGRHRRRTNIVDTPDETCRLHCKAARCCRVPSYIEGLILSSSGVYTDGDTGDYVVTNCKDEFGDNNDLCAEYDKFCDHDGLGVKDGSLTDESLTATPEIKPSTEPSTGPSFSPTGNFELFKPWTSRPTVTLPPTKSLSPTLNPTMTAHPSLLHQPSASPTSSTPPTSSTAPTSADVPRANTLEISASCSGTENYELISAGMTTTRTKCLGACSAGICCFSEELGYGSWMPSCFEGNMDRCLEYVGCLVLVPGYEMLNPGDSGGTMAENGNNVASTSNNTNQTGNVIEEDNAFVLGLTIDITGGDEDPSTAAMSPEVNFEAPPTPSQDLASICSQDSLSTPEGPGQCANACQLASSCCNAQEEEESSCYFDYKEICDLYKPCMNLDSVAPQIFPEVPSEEESVASPGDNSSTTKDEPETAIEEPDLPLPPSSEEDIVSQPLLTQAQLPPAANAKISMVCSYETLAYGTTGGSACFSMCQSGSCCSDYGSCLTNGYEMYSQEVLDSLNDVCETYRPCDNLFLKIDPPSDLDEICDGTNEEECAARCSPVSCCFSKSDSCSEYFQENCLAYAPYCVQTPANSTTAAALEQPTPAATNTAINIVDPPSPPPAATEDLAALCSFSFDFCSAACQDASCCFQEPSSDLSCLDGNNEICDGWSPCAVVFDQQS